VLEDSGIPVVVKSLRPLPINEVLISGYLVALDSLARTLSMGRCQLYRTEKYNLIFSHNGNIIVVLITDPHDEIERARELADKILAEISNLKNEDPEYLEQVLEKYIPLGISEQFSIRAD